MDDTGLCDQGDVEAIVSATLAALPPVFAARLASANLVVMVAARPTEAQRHAVHLASGHDLYGLYEGIPLSARNQGYNLVAPDVITIFADVLLRDFPSRTALTRQVRRTVLHELAHHWGIDDERLHELGAY
ncbi:MAG: metallopeptidase family protein [Herpetosiphonaceae bacterium]|nr:metallopeptidase family protein [Herpetosiphonaceae bacterium]